MPGIRARRGEDRWQRSPVTRPQCAVAVCSALLRIRVFSAALWPNKGSTDVPGYQSFRTILAVGCPRGPIPFVGRVSAGAVRTNARSTHESVPVIYILRTG